MGIRRRIAYVYPGVRKSGVGALILDGRDVIAVAVGSLPRETVGPVLEVFRPDELVVSDTKIHDKDHGLVDIPSTITNLRFARSGWENHDLPLTDREHPQRGAYVHNVYKLLFDDGIRRRDVRLFRYKVEEFTPEWAQRNAPRTFR